VLDWSTVRAQANDDAEFQLHARFWNSTVKLDIGSESTRIDIANGEIRSIEPWLGGLAGNLHIAAPEDDWARLLEAVPKPFYQDVYPASVHHGFEIHGDTTHFCAYYPALRRFVEIMREVHNG
jgi:hypothetical protein